MSKKPTIIIIGIIIIACIIALITIFVLNIFMKDKKVEEEIEISEKLFNTITTFQDTVHETAIEYHRKLREGAVTKSVLDEIEGIGEKKKQALLQEFGTVEKIKNATVEELTKIKGINLQLASEILNKLR